MVHLRLAVVLCLKSHAARGIWSSHLSSPRGFQRGAHHRQDVGDRDNFCGPFIFGQTEVAKAVAGLGSGGRLLHDEESSVDLSYHTGHWSRPGRDARMGFRQLLKGWRFFALFVVSLGLLPFPLVIKTKLAGAAYVLILSVIFYLLMPLPLPMNAMMPVFLYPLLGVHPASLVATWFMNDPSALLISSMIFSLAIENVSLHERIALKLLTVLGTAPERLLLAFLVVSGFLSMWISNIAVVVMLLPIAVAVKHELQRRTDIVQVVLDSDPEGTEVPKSVDKKVEKFAMGLTLSVVYGACIGGMATLIGAHPNIMFKLVMDQFYGDVTGVSFATHLMICGPLAVVAVFLTWLFMTAVYARGFITQLWKKRVISAEQHDRQERLLKTLEVQYQKLGSVRFEEGSVIFFFSLLLVLWLFRSPAIFPGWEVLFVPRFVSDNTPTMLVVTILFVWPKSLKALWEDGDFEPVLTWPVVQKRFPWEILFFVFGTNVLSEGSTQAGIAKFVAEAMEVLVFIPPWVMVIILSVVTSALTEFVSNVTLVTLLLPILATFAQHSRVNPIYYLLPAALSTMCSFMMPVSSPITALVYGAGHVSMKEMIKIGLIPKIICLALMILFVNGLGDVVYDVHRFPSWANRTLTNATVSPRVG